MDSLTSVAAIKQGLKNQSEKFFSLFVQKIMENFYRKLMKQLLDLHLTGLNDTKHVHFRQKIPNSINRRHSQVKCIQCHKTSKTKSYDYILHLNQHYAQMFILKDVYEEGNNTRI